ncbi:MAG: alpha/beta hydrolase [Spongiibacteraceae bacterium]
MHINKVHPELRKVIGRIPPIPFHNRLFISTINFLSKIAPRAKSLPGVILTEKSLNSAGVRIYRPEKLPSGAALFWIHGGGLITGNAAMNDRECASYARELGLVVVSVEYRLAPKHPFPAAIDDCYEAWQWLQTAAKELGVDPSRIVISGQSAGGGLAASLAQRIHDQGGVQPAAQALFCPMLDDRTAARKELDAIKHRIWNNTNNRVGWFSYLGQPAGVAAVPAYAVPARREDLSGLPSTWISVGDIELFYAEACEYSQRLKSAGVNCELYEIPMAPHGFEAFVPNAPITRALYADFYQFLRKSLGLLTTY